MAKSRQVVKSNQKEKLSPKFPNIPCANNKGTVVSFEQWREQCE